ncbi:hypothetical protein CLIB1423_11S02476 [[Candida] railenensis]|uniref:Uncharacterized protein n=1 Tax=[Candida] railenensis TaxID=45579 RepID=A0A9P0QRF9_9ASCO|nr:hypothetical protein CLIB1423_11S02476 [[Candida] railenensis]
MLYRIAVSILISLIIFLNLFSPTVPLSLKKNSEFPPLVLPIHVRFGDEGYIFPDLVEAAQLQVNSELENLQIKNWKVLLVDELEESRNIDREKNSLKVTESKLISGVDEKSQNRNQEISNDVYSIVLFRSGDISVGVDTEQCKTYLFYTASAVYANDLPFFITQAVIHHFMKSEILMLQNDEHEINLPSNLTVNFATPLQDDPINQLDWSSAMQMIFQPFYEILYQKAGMVVDSFKIQRDWSPINNLDDGELTYYCSQNVSFYPNYKYIATNPELMKFISDSIYAIEKQMGIPEHPDNNLRLKLQMVKRVVAVRKLRKVRELLMELISKGVISSKSYVEEYENLVGTGGMQPGPADDEISAWEQFFDRCEKLLQKIELVEENGGSILRLYYKIVWNYFDLVLSFLIGMLLFTLYIG